MITDPIAPLGTSRTIEGGPHVPPALATARLAEARRATGATRADT
jgi:hypothetical protein